MAPHRQLQDEDSCNVVVGAAGIEPATTGLEIRCSIRLSYAPLSKIYHKLGLEYYAVSRDLRHTIPAGLH
jgi:hypothetical protein